MTLRLLILALLLVPLWACGVRGPLYLPETGAAEAGEVPASTGDGGREDAEEDEPGEPDGTGR